MGLTIVIIEKRRELRMCIMKRVVVCQSDSSSGRYWGFCNHLMET